MLASGLSAIDPTYDTQATTVYSKLFQCAYLLSMPLDGLEFSVSVRLTPRCDYLSPVENLVIAMLEHASLKGIRTKDTSRVLPERLFLIRAYTSNILKL